MLKDKQSRPDLMGPDPVPDPHLEGKNSRIARHGITHSPVVVALDVGSQCVTNWEQGQSLLG